MTTLLESETTRGQGCAGRASRLSTGGHRLTGGVAPVVVTPLEVERFRDYEMAAERMIGRDEDAALLLQLAYVGNGNAFG